jgi:hypothetical protein
MLVRLIVLKIVQKAAVLGIESQFPPRILAVELVGPVRFRTFSLRNESGRGVARIEKCGLGGRVLIQARDSD